MHPVLLDIIWAFSKKIYQMVYRGIYHKTSSRKLYNLSREDYYRQKAEFVSGSNLLDLLKKNAFSSIEPVRFKSIHWEINAEDFKLIHGEPRFELVYSFCGLPCTIFFYKEMAGPYNTIFQAHFLEGHLFYGFVEFEKIKPVDIEKITSSLFRKYSQVKNMPVFGSDFTLKDQEGNIVFTQSNGYMLLVGYAYGSEIFRNRVNNLLDESEESGKVVENQFFHSILEKL